jgi:hypothetical protein
MLCGLRQANGGLNRSLLMSSLPHVLLTGGQKKAPETL